MRSHTARLVLILALGLLLAPLAADAQQPTKVPRIGFLGVASAAAYASQLEGFRQGLRERGYVEGQNIVIEYRWAEGKYDRLLDLAGELVRLKVDLIVTHGTPGTGAVKQATRTIPIVMVVAGDAVASGLVSSLARPGGNITGSTYFLPELAAKRLELLKQAIPRVSRVAVLLNPGNPVHRLTIKAMELAAQSLRVELQPVEVRGPHDLDGAFLAIIKGRAGALVVVDDAMLNSQAKRIAELATKSRLPLIGFGDHVKAGGLMAYGVNFPQLFREAAVFVDKILKGAKPGDLPVEQATRFEFVINLRTAKALGLTIPQSVLTRADEVIH